MQKSNIDLIDTAISYGESEIMLGNAGVVDFKFVSKLPSISKTNIDANLWAKEMIRKSMRRIGIRTLYGILLHRSNDLLGKNGYKLIKTLNRLKLNGIVKKIGISIYDPSEIDNVINLIDIDIVQAPLNIIDRRLETSGWLNKLHKQNIEIHTRSTFLQGLLLLNHNNIPSKFSKWKNLFERWFFELKKNKLSPLQVCLSYPLSLKEIDRVIVGVNSAKQLVDIIKLSKLKKINQDFSFMSSNDEKLLNPYNWKNL